MKRTSFLGVSSKRSYMSYRFNFSFFSVTCWGIDLDYRDIEWFALETNRDHSVVFEMHPSTAFRTPLLTVMATPFLLRDSRPQY